MKSWTVTALACAVSATLSSGVTAAIVRARQPDTFALRGGYQTTAEQRALVALLADPGAPFRADSAGAPVDGKALGLTSLGFRRGWVRTWRSPNARIDAYVLEFDKPTGASGYAAGLGRVAGRLIEPVPFVVDGVPGASGLADAKKDATGRYAQVVALHRGRRAVLLVFSDTDATPSGALHALVRRQYDALA